MQNKDEDILNGLVRHKLDEFIPDVTLLESSYKNFRLEQQKRKKWRFFWPFFTALLMALTGVGYYYLISKSQHGRSSIPASNMQLQPGDLPASINITRNAALDTVKYDSTNSTAIADSINLHLLSTSNIRNIQWGNKNSVENEMDSHTNIDDTTVNKHVTNPILFTAEGYSVPHILKTDSALKRNIKPSVDTFYIVW